jgi:serine/threonine-protein kinase PRP4
MLKMHMELKGPFSNKMLKKGMYTKEHFDENFNFLEQEYDSISNKIMIKKSNIVKTRDLKDLLKNSYNFENENIKLFNSFFDLLDKTLNLDPLKRITTDDALKHSFLN